MYIVLDAFEFGFIFFIYWYLHLAKLAHKMFKMDHVSSASYTFKSSTHWLLELINENVFLDILEIFRLDVGQISSNLLKKAFAAWHSHIFLSTSVAF